MLRPALPLLLVVLTLAACAPGPQGPGLLAPAEIAAARAGSLDGPDNAELIARANLIAARAQALRTTTIDAHEAALRRRRGLR
jgi:hypothetical protein